MENHATELALISIDTNRCQGHCRCAMLAPELFTSDEYGFGQVRGDGRVPGEHIAKAELAIANCPESAIILTRPTA